MKKILCLALLSAPLVASPVHACTIPVFRYAFENWGLTPYEIMIFHRDPLPDALSAELKNWQAAPNKANLDITLVDLGGDMTVKQQKLWKRDGNDNIAPWMIVRYTAADPGDPSAFVGPATLGNLKSVIDSPLRREMLGHLKQGVSAVFVLMSSDDPVADRAALELATRELALLERRIKLPQQSDDGPKIKLPLPLKVSFPIIVLNRKKPEEAAFVRMLLATEDRLFEAKGPILFPIFGRGRVLGGLTGPKELTADSLTQVAKFLCRECSCQVKDLNPGSDILIAADWNKIFDAMFEANRPPKTNPTPPKKNVDAPPVEAPSTESPRSPVSISVDTTLEAPASDARTPLRFVIWVGLGFASGLVLLSGGWLVLQLQR